MNNYSYNSYNPYNNYPSLNNTNDERLIGGGFIFPFLLGGVTGAVISNARPPYYGYNRPPYYYGPGQIYYNPAPIRPPRWYW